MYSQQIKKLNFNVIEIINNEVISAGQSLSNGQVSLIHCRVNPGGHLELTVKGNNNETLDQLITQLVPSALSSSLF